ncbi:MAG: hypothetical protein QGH51_08895 [Planctomycetota bacterium]|nr:hypothetical protein [Planctomycetota bacterium]MDP6942126.1 hypothetical protein [Planctomycetota bacterium]
MKREDSFRRKLRRRFKHKPGPIPWFLALPQRIFFRILGLFPEKVVYRFSDSLGRLALLFGKRHEIGMSNLLRALPEAGKDEHLRILRASCGHLGRAGGEAMALWPRRDLSTLNERVEFEEGSLRLLERYKGKGVLFIQAHLGAIEMTTTVLANLGFQPATPMRRPSNWYLAEDLLKVRNRIKGEVLPRDGALKRMLTKLQSNETVVLTFDQNSHRKPIFVPWFGHLAATERTPAALALKTGVPVLLSYCVRQTGNRPFKFGCQLVREGAKAATSEEKLLEVTKSFHQAMESVILSCPEQYLWIHDRYRVRPEVE